MIKDLDKKNAIFVRNQHNKNAIILLLDFIVCLFLFLQVIQIL
nr:hypothetical protein [Borreliella carolinensis]WNY65416.1 hypothetical protein QIA46_04420 [Borreliella carolinensis]